MPYFALGLILVTMSSVYRLKVVGRNNVPTEGGALLVSNHVSFVDALMLITSIDRQIQICCKPTLL